MADLEDQPLTTTELDAKYGKDVYNIAYRIVCNKEDAEDVRQDVFAKWHEHRDYWVKPESEQKKLLFQMARNRAIEIARKNQRHPQPISLDSSIDHANPDGPSLQDRVPDQSPTPLEIVERAETSEQIRTQLLKHLPPEMAAAIVLYYVEGLKYEEVAYLLKMTLSTARRRIIAGCAKIRDNLTQDLDDQKNEMPDITCADKPKRRKPQVPPTPAIQQHDVAAHPTHRPGW